jgi:hypothetical protein
MPPPAPAPVWSAEQLAQDAVLGIWDFRQRRMREPLEQYLRTFAEYREVVAALLAGTGDLRELSERAGTFLTDPNMLTAVRYLASPAISADDLKTLAEVTLTPARLRSDPEMAQRVVACVLLGLDRARFPWIAQGRPPTESEREAAVVSTTSLIATQRVQTDRRNTAKDEQEGAVAARLLELGFTEVERRHVRNTLDLPGPGEFCGESLFGSRKADLIVRLWDGRCMPTECKVSNSATNSVKRLNNDAAKKAKTWREEFGTATTVPVAVLSGVFKVHNLQQAQAEGLTIFWAHALGRLGQFIQATRDVH